ncbi:hypothetical protein U27_05495 [Candidatus Vecturithrix granuli]|uniref:Uncharacterized protein n=1 Tax=Vecturithrix granuli TaxID=1499967 RepID=A0A081C1R6_VECG1|nr:hypothetical protein U27_05495 [Candidatus Vecturithrix granuli]
MLLNETDHQLSKESVQIFIGSSMKFHLTLKWSSDMLYAAISHFYEVSIQERLAGGNRV